MIPAASPQMQSGTSAFSAQSSSFDGKRPGTARKEEPRVLDGRLYHRYDPEKAPYPLCYDRQVLELEALDNRLMKHLKGSTSFINFSEGPPQRSLDLGCGTGTWVIDAAKEWPDCSFVGFDLVNVQISLRGLDPSITRRIRWVHGNFLTTKLPFEDDEFDHVHIQSIARGVPESKWGVLFEEVNRVLRPGGAVEIIEDDIIFPVLPRWFTAPLRARPRRASSVHFPGGPPRDLSPPPSLSKDMHDHSLLESLFRSVFGSRFINLKPTAVLPSYFTTYFRHVVLGPVLHFPMPPLPPLQPLPQQLPPSSAFDTPPTDSADSKSPTFHPVPMNRPTSLSLSSTLSASTNATKNSSLFSRAGRGKSSSISSNGDTSSLSSDAIDEGDSETPVRDTTPVPFQRYYIDRSLTEDSTSVSSQPQALFRSENLAALNERSLAMHLYRGYQTVLACQEAMWDELIDRLRNKKEELKPYGWEDDEELEALQHRMRFERLIERYRSDMQARIALWCSLCGIGWPFPPREPLTKAELIEEERIREGMLEARNYATPEDLQAPCRALRALVGYKSLLEER
ncbi:S-adenosyl-L-methionine-dependent methyltransferase [Pleurotus eryngii]|uniref:S-adenosyl-L-methionine-dependent methyltransferase n=1 Tax=Pleurotus eryngii TaxID=5323 RepID=A0A9P6DD42_PLEER|nr:S-adenosyl-L-methionine-dependent methyltransferase [Pleurotus eryngii]